MANEEHLAILQQGVEVWNQWRDENRNIRPDLRWVNLREMDLRYANFSDAAIAGSDLSGADLGKANLSDADLNRTYLSRANLGAANLSWANLEAATLREANLRLAQLIEANLVRATLSDADICAANLRKADLRSADLSGAQLIEADLRQANLSGCRITRIAAWDLKLKDCIQENLIISMIAEPTISVDDLGIGQLIHLTLVSEDSLKAINSITTKIALILGRFTPEREPTLNAIRGALRQDGRYIPVVFNFDTPTYKDIRKPLGTLARLACFVIADITDPQGLPQELVSVVDQMPSLPVQPLLQSGHEPWEMYDRIHGHPGVRALCPYDSPETLRADLGPKVIEPTEVEAEKRAG